MQPSFKRQLLYAFCIACTIFVLTGWAEAAIFSISDAFDVAPPVVIWSMIGVAYVGWWQYGQHKDRQWKKAMGKYQ